MDKSKLSTQDWQMILESLKYTKKTIEEYARYPSQEFKQERIEEVTALIAKIKNLLQMD